MTFETEVQLRFLVTTKDAGIIIGKNGSQISKVREETNVQIGVSNLIPNVKERVVTITGELRNVAMAVQMIAEAVMDASSVEKITIRLLIAHQLAGSVIGKSGSKIKSIQEGSGAKIVISKDLLPQSTERVIEVVGSKESIHKALLDVGECLIADKDVVEGLIMYDPHHSLRKPGFSYTSSLNRSNLLIQKGIPKYVAKKKSSNEIEGSTTSKIAVPLEMVGCIIGPRGACINEIRESSGAKIHIASQESGRDERDVLITGSANAIATALQLLEKQLEEEKAKNALVL